MKFSTERTRLLAAAMILLLGLASGACMSAQKRDLAQKKAASHVALALKLVEQNRLNEALTQANMALAQWEEDPEGHLVRGQVNFMLGLYSSAIQDFNRAMEVQEDLTQALVWRGWAFAESGDPVQAEKDWMKALTDPAYPTPEKVHLNLGLLMIRQGRRAEGRRHLELAVSTKPGYARGHFELGKLQQEDADYRQAAASYQAAMGGMKNSPDLNLRMGLVLEAQGQGARAREYFKRVLELSPDGPESELARDHLKRLDSAT